MTRLVHYVDGDVDVFGSVRVEGRTFSPFNIVPIWVYRTRNW